MFVEVQYSRNSRVVSSHHICILRSVKTKNCFNCFICEQGCSACIMTKLLIVNINREEPFAVSNLPHMYGVKQMVPW